MSNSKKDLTDPYADLNWDNAVTIDDNDIDLNVDELFKNACRELEAAGKRAQESFAAMGKTMGRTQSPFNFAETPDQLYARDPEAYQRAKDELAQSSRLVKEPKNG